MSPGLFFFFFKAEGELKLQWHDGVKAGVPVGELEILEASRENSHNFSPLSVCPLPG